MRQAKLVLLSTILFLSSALYAWPNKPQSKTETVKIETKAEPVKPKVGQPITDPAEQEVLSRGIISALSQQIEALKAQLRAAQETLPSTCGVWAASQVSSELIEKAQKKYNAEGCTLNADKTWKCPPPPPEPKKAEEPVKPVPMCGDKPCTEKIEDKPKSP